MTMEQAKFIVEVLHKAVPVEPGVKLAEALVLMYKADEFEAHRIISYVLTHLMSDEHNALYVIDQLGLRE